MNGLTDIPGLKVGHISDYEALTGVTAILCEGGAVAGVDIGGGASGTEEFDTMNPLHIAGRVHAVVLAGGSAFGLEAASGVRRHLEKKGIGFPAGAVRVPIVPAMILFDLGIGKSDVRPTREMGEAAAAAASSGPVAEGNVGAGTGATVGKIFGMQRAMKGGIGSFTVRTKNATVSALAAVNAFGDVRDPESGKLLAGARQDAKTRALANTVESMIEGVTGGFRGGNTTLCVVATTAKLSKVGATRLAKMAQAGLLRTLSPGHTTSDGDIVIALSLGDDAEDINTLGVAAAEALAYSIARGVQTAKTLGGVPGMAG